MQDQNDGFAGTTVLYVEDEPMNVLLMQALFDRRPHLNLVVACNGWQAWELSARLQPSLLMLDLRLPDCHGSELLPVLRRRPGWGRLPAVAVTAEHEFQINGTGFIEVWNKPLDLMRVLARLDLWLAAPQSSANMPLSTPRGRQQASGMGLSAAS